NWPGRTVLQIREERALRDFLCTYLRGAGTTAVAKVSPAEVRKTLIELVKGEQAAGRLTLTAVAPTPLGWHIRNVLHLLGVPLLGLPVALIFFAYLPIYLFQLLRRDIMDPDLAPLPP